MFKFFTKNYSLPVTSLFMVIGFGLLIGVIVFHDHINNNRYFSPPITIAGNNSGMPVPQEVINEVVRSSKNISPLSTSYSPTNSPLFITQQ